MMFKCCECGHLFEDGEQAVWEERHGFINGPFEKWSGCPLCKSDYEEVHQCEECGDWHTEDELYSGWCEKCLRETINYDTFFEYCEANKEYRYLELFVMVDLLNMDVSNFPDYVSFEFRQLMIKCYKESVEAVTSWEKMEDRPHPDAFLDRCIRFIMDDDGSIGRENYADWLNKREGSK